MQLVETKIYDLVCCNQLKAAGFMQLRYADAKEEVSRVVAGS